MTDTLRSEPASLGWAILAATEKLTSAGAAGPGRGSRDRARHRESAPQGGVLAVLAVGGSGEGVPRLHWGNVPSHQTHQTHKQRVKTRDVMGDPTRLGTPHSGKTKL